MKYCAKCEMDLPLAEFRPGQSYCSPCARVYAREHYQQNRERYRESQRAFVAENRDRLYEQQRRYRQSDKGRRAKKNARLKADYGLSMDEFDAMNEAQDGRCAACGGLPCPGRYTTLHVDHDHETGRVRGLLCHPCNTALGLLQEDPDRMTKLIDYVSVHAS